MTGDNRPMSILITGASGGLGPAVADAFLAAGETVYGVARSWKKGNPHNSAKFHAIEADVNTDEGCDTAVEAAAPVKVLVHLVGGFGGGQPVQTTDDAVFDQMINANLRSAFRMIRAVLPGMQGAGYGRMIVMGSRAGEEPMAGFACYTVAKAGVAALVRTVALENKGSGITANVVAPSIIDTPANRKSMPQADHSKWVKAESIAKVILWLASEKSSDVSGAVIPVYGSV
jgi:NAD(P)-dependent dehydrogenase (short-subunit alcohol dehydrogenase family)